MTFQKYTRWSLKRNLDKRLSLSHLQIVSSNTTSFNHQIAKVHFYQSKIQSLEMFTTKKNALLYFQ